MRLPIISEHLLINNYDIRGHGNRFFSLYLIDRKQFIPINGIQITLKGVQCGVPQRFLLGPIILYMYMNDLHTTIGTEHTRLFAGNASIYLYAKKLAELIVGCKEKHTKIIKWCYDNKLTVNHDNTLYLYFNTKNNQSLGDFSALISMEFLYRKWQAPNT